MAEAEAEAAEQAAAVGAGPSTGAADAEAAADEELRNSPPGAAPPEVHATEIVTIQSHEEQQPTLTAPALTSTSRCSRSGFRHGAWGTYFYARHQPSGPKRSQSSPVAQNIWQGTSHDQRCL